MSQETTAVSLLVAMRGSMSSDGSTGQYINSRLLTHSGGLKDRSNHQLLFITDHLVSAKELECYDFFYACPSHL
jgi:hypothetical protein